MKTHQLKSWPEYFKPISMGMKTFDLRKDDRGYNVGDDIQFEEFNVKTGDYTGAVATRRISYILRDFAGLMPGYCILGITNSGDVR
jgi:Domain of unknown function (DUF3850)